MSLMNVYLFTTGCFDRGGISRYTRYQILSLEDNPLINLTSFSFLGPNFNPLENSQTLPKIYSASIGFPSALDKLLFSFRFLFKIFRFKPNKVILAHVNLLILAPVIKFFSPSTKIILNIYGLEVWSSNKFLLSFYTYFIELVISDCHNTASYFRTNINESIPINVVWDCVDSSLFNAPLSSRPFSFPYIATMGRLSFAASHKGYIRLLHAFARISSSYPQLKLVFIGDGDMKNYLANTASDLGISSSVIFTGFVSDSDAGYYLSNATVFSLVSEVSFMKGEGIPLTPLESLACGTPIIVGDQDGSRECIQSMIGFAIDPHSIEDHINSLEYFLNLDEASYSKVSSLCISTVDKYFSFSTFSQKLNQLILGS